MASYAMAIMQTPFTKSHKPHMPRGWTDGTPHAHRALDDAMGHEIVFCNIVVANDAARPAGG